jgi:hypothetical protein
VFCKKRLDLPDFKGVAFFGGAKEAASDRKQKGSVIRDLSSTTHCADRKSGERRSAPADPADRTNSLEWSAMVTAQVRIGFNQPQLDFRTEGGSLTS